MIAKRIMSPKGGVGYKRLAGYVLNVSREHQPADPASWTRLNAYILDTAHRGEKVAWARATNCQTDDPGWAVKEILATQAQNTHSRSDKSYHLVVSFPEGERPTRAQLEDVEDCLCVALGFEEHQRVSAVHQNTDNWHLHIVINKVHWHTFRNVEPFRDHYRLQEACVELEIRHGLRREPHTTGWEQGREGHDTVRGRAADIEAQQCAQSFLRWLRENAVPDLLAARDRGQGWQELHRVAARYDLGIKTRGSGLVIGHLSDTGLHVRASGVDRGFAMKALTDALGPYQSPASATMEAATLSYARPQPTGALYEAFKQEREAALTVRMAALKALRDQHLTYTHQLKAYYRHRFRQERLTGLHGFLRRDSFRHILEQQAKDRAERMRREAEERRQARARHPIPTWRTYLERETANGNDAALLALRGRMQRRVPMESQLIQAQDAQEARHVIRRHLRPTVRRDGRLIYRTWDGGIVSDEARRVRVSETTAGAVLLALSIAAERFAHRPLMVLGTDEFRSQVAKLAAIEGLNVTFSDGTLEKQRLSARDDRTRGVAHHRSAVHSIYEVQDINAERDNGW